jgi:hypothetical protein
MENASFGYTPEFEATAGMPKRTFGVEPFGKFTIIFE